MSRNVPNMTTLDIYDLMDAPYFILDQIESQYGDLPDEGYSFVIIEPAPLYSHSRSHANLVTHDPHSYYNDDWLVEPISVQELNRIGQTMKPIRFTLSGGWMFPPNSDRPSQDYIVYVLDEMVTQIQNNPRNNMRRNNPDQRTVDLRAKYRAKHGDDWWRDEDIKAEYRAERREIYRSGPPSDPTGRRKQTSTTTSSKKSQKPKRKVTRRDPIKAMAVVLGTKSSKEASTIIVNGVSVAVPEGVSVTRKDLKTRSNFTVQTDDGQKMVVSVTPSGRTTVKQYTADGDKHFERSFSLDEWLDGQEVIEIYLNDVMVEYGEEDIDYDEQEILDDQALIAAVPKKVSDAFFAIVDKLEELPDSYHNDTGLFYDHVIDEGGVMLKIVLTDIPRKPRLNVDFSDDIKVIKGRNVKEYKLSSTTAAFKYIKKWIESYL